MESAEDDLDPDHVALVAEARRLYDRAIDVRVARNELGAVLVLVLEGAGSGEAALLRKHLVAFRVARGIEAPFVVAPDGPTGFVTKNPKPPTHWPPTTAPGGAP